MSVVVDSESGHKMENSSSIEQDYVLWVLLVQTGETIYRARRKELRAYGISTMQAAALTVIQAIGHKATPAEISRWLLRERHSVSELVSRMEKRGLVKKVRDLDRRNQVRIVLTKKGREACYKSAKRESIHKMISSLSAEERQQLRSCLEGLRDKAAKEVGIDHEMPFPPLQ